MPIVWKEEPVLSYFGLSFVPLAMMIVATAPEGGSYATLGLSMLALLLSPIFAGYGVCRIVRRKPGDNTRKLLVGVALSIVPIVWWLVAWVVK